MHSFEVEEVSKIGKDMALDIDILPNRAGDCFSHLGVAREIAALTGLECKKPEIKIREGKKELVDLVSVEVKAGCSRYALRAVENVKISPSPRYIQERLKTCGIKPINNVVDVLNYVMLETGQPLHVFDGKKIEDSKIIVRSAKKREKIVTLDEKRYELDSDILVIADLFSPIAIAGIKGGILPEVDKNTRLVYLEAAHFDAQIIRRGSQKLGLRTDASFRFEHGLPLELSVSALDRAVSLIVETAGGIPLKGRIDHFQKEREEEKIIRLEAEEVRDILGIQISLEKIEKTLRALGFQVKKNKTTFQIKVPYFRMDIDIKEDIIEEIGRVYGYEKIEVVEPQGKIAPILENKIRELNAKAKDFWKILGFSEAYNYSFLDNEKGRFFIKEKIWEIEKPVSLEYKYLRPSLLPGLLKNTRLNEKNFEAFKLFELGKVFFKENKILRERNHLAAVSLPYDFYKMKGELNIFLEKITQKAPNYSYLEKDESEMNSIFFDLAESAKIIIGNSEIGFLGKISPDIKRKMEIMQDIVLLELNLEKLYNIEGEISHRPISKFPIVMRDLSILVPEKTPYGHVAEVIKKSSGENLREILLFDVYTGSSLPKEKKNFSFRLTFQSHKKTLSSQETNKLQERIIRALNKISDWKVRK